MIQGWVNTVTAGSTRIGVRGEIRITVDEAKTYSVVGEEKAVRRAEITASSTVSSGTSLRPVRGSRPSWRSRRHGTLRRESIAVYTRFLSIECSSGITVNKPFYTLIRKPLFSATPADRAFPCPDRREEIVPPPERSPPLAAAGAPSGRGRAGGGGRSNRPMSARKRAFLLRRRECERTNRMTGRHYFYPPTTRTRAAAVSNPGADETVRIHM